jgi:hypothetical protein
MRMRKNLRTPDQVKRKKRNRFSPTRIVVLLAMAALAIGVGTVVFSQSGQDRHPRQKDFKNPPSVRNGKKYVATRDTIFDQASGTLRKPTVAETEALVDQLSSLTNRTTDGLTVIEYPDGTKAMNLEGRFSGVVLGRARADGTTEIRCVMTMEEATEFLGLVETTSEQGQ